MICHRNVILVLDANILIRLLANSATDVVTTLQEWLRSAIETANCDVSGKTITLAVSNRILNDYSTGLVRAKKPNLGTAVRFFFTRYHGTKIPIESQRGRFFAIPTILSGEHSFIVPNRLKRWKLDKFDLPYFSLLETTLNSRRLCDRAILFGCNDWKTRNGALDYATVVVRESRVTCAEMASLARDLAD
ncbi:MAG: hypothetical protein ABSF09_13915 [Candidatus Bathyarchaeia archaeon]